MSDDTVEDLELKVRQLDSKIIDQEVAQILLQYAGKLLSGTIEGKISDTTDQYARQIVGYLREHLVH